MGDQMESAQRVEPHQEDSKEGLPLSCEQWAQVAKFVISEALSPEGVKVPEEDFKGWVSALGSYYEEENLNG